MSAEDPMIRRSGAIPITQIFSGFMELYLGDSVPEPIGPVGRAIERIEVKKRRGGTARCRASAPASHTG
jgi:hypothetical protein